MAHVRDAVMAASGAVTAGARTPLDCRKWLRALSFPDHMPAGGRRMLMLGLDRSQTLPQAVENRILTKAADSAASMRRPH